MTIGLLVHALAAVIWVGGMFFAYMVLRPATGSIDPHARLDLWGQVFGQFFPWVWASIVALLVSGYAMIFFGLGGFAGAGVHVHIMQATGLLMMALFLHLYFAPWRRLRRALDARRPPGGGGPARPDPPDRRDQSRARPDHGRDRRQRPLLALVVKIQRNVPDARGPRRGSPECGF